jgi:lactoylglutathione lyase
MNRFMKTNLILMLIMISIGGAYAQTSKPAARFNHAAIFVTDLQVTKAFYENIIGLDTIPEPFHDGKHAWYRLGPGISLHVIEGATEKKAYYKNQHTCLSVASVDDFTVVLKKNKIVFEDLKGNKNVYSTRVDGVKQLWLQDPDGYWIEINDAKE